jgi:hypothetical protein
MIGAAVAAAAACSTSPAAAISVTPTSSLADEPLSIRITGLSPNATAQVAVATTDRDGQTWTGQAAYAASADGTLDPNTASSTGGTYSGVHAMGLVSSMQPPKDAPAKNDGWFSWPDQPPR